MEEFNDYLKQVGALYEQLRRIQEHDENESKADKPKSEDANESIEGFLNPFKNKSSRRGSTASLTSLASMEGSPRRRSSISLRKASQGPPPLSTIPTVYFDDDFHLENPRTFDVVSERSEVVRPANLDGRQDSMAPRKTLATNAILQEKLSWYMDTIEVHLINSISTASTTFFTALGSLKELHSEASDSVDRIKTLRLELEALDREIATAGLDVVQKSRRQDNLQKLNDAVAQLKRIVDDLATCESLVDAGEVDKALVSIKALENLIAGQVESTNDGMTLRDLRGAAALQGVNTDLGSLRFRIGKAYETQFSNILMTDLRRHVETVSVPDVMQRWSNAATRARGSHSRTASVFPTYLTATEELKSQLQPIMEGLKSAQYVPMAAMAYKDAVLREIRNIIRRPLPSSGDDDNMSMLSVSTTGGNRHLSGQEKSVNLARNLRALDPEDAEELLMKIYVGVAETLRRLSTQVKVLLDIAASISDPIPDGVKSPPLRSPMTSPRPERFGDSGAGPFELQEELHKILDVSSLSAQGVDVAIDRIVKVLKVRSEQSVSLPVDLFLRYFSLNLYFANECEAISGRVGASLKNVVNGHIKDFVQKNRDTEMQKLAQAMESDQWGAKDFTDKNTKLLNQILECSTHDAAEWLEGSKLWIPATEIAKLNLELSEPVDVNGVSEKEKSRPAIIESEKFLLPASAILCLEGAGNFLHLVSGIPSMTTDIATSLLSYLQLFNSRCTQLILGAGATRSAGLKNITTKHLALASLALSFIATLIPHMREFMRRHAGSGAGVSSLMGEFDKIRRVLQEHQDNIHQKLVEIMSGRAAVHSKSIKATKWDTESTDSAHAYMETLSKETTTLHRVLTKHLPETSIQMIMLPVFASYKEQLGGAFKEANVKTTEGKQSMLRDVELFSAKLGKLDGFTDSGEYLKGVVEAKEVETKPPPPPAKEDSGEVLFNAEVDDHDESKTKVDEKALPEKPADETAPTEDMKDMTPEVDPTIDTHPEARVESNAEAKEPEAVSEEVTKDEPKKEPSNEDKAEAKDESKDEVNKEDESEPEESQQPEAGESSKEDSNETSKGEPKQGAPKKGKKKKSKKGGK